jgi:hypothetical protein
MGKRDLIWLGVCALGLLMVAAALTPPLNPPQCPDHATRMPDGSHCIIGANIGAGLLWLAGVFVAFIGAVGLVISLMARLWDRRPSVGPRG